MHRTILWFRRDLRLEDNAALVAASDAGIVIPVYLPDWELRHAWAPGEAARWWLGTSLRRLADELESRGAPLRVASGDPETALASMCRRFEAERVVWHRLYEPEVLALDRRVVRTLASAGVACEEYPGALLFEPEHLVSGAGKPYVQFTAFWRHCLGLPEPTAPHLARSGLQGLPLEPGETSAADFLSQGERGFASSKWKPVVRAPAMRWEPGESGAIARMLRFKDDALADYETGRDFPDREGVSRLSPHLHFGEISPRRLWHSVKGAPGWESFLRQLGWREFAHHLLWHFPHTPTEPFRASFSRFPWADDTDGLEAWRSGETGFPLVDAGMRQLLSEGWMHNRVRMVVASFLTKDLLIPWQEGAEWFWDRLLDADLANNTLGWQWTAGSGPDAAPYFRVYNPQLQRERFDPASVYVRRWAAAGAPIPIVDHSFARERALAAYREVRQGR